LRAAYAAFNGRDIDAALALMTPDVEWPRAFKGGFVKGHEGVRAYWTEQWTEIDPRVEPRSFIVLGPAEIIVEVQQSVRNLEGTVVADEIVFHKFTMTDDLIRKMEVRPQ
jgi:ketosteroid isomerase-like protein